MINNLFLEYIFDMTTDDAYVQVVRLDKDGIGSAQEDQARRVVVGIFDNIGEAIEKYPCLQQHSDQLRVTLEFNFMIDHRFSEGDTLQIGLTSTGLKVTHV